MSLITEFRPLYTVNGASFAILDFPIEGGSTSGGSGGQDFTPGQVVLLNDAIRLQEAKLDTNTVIGVAADSARVGGTALAQDQPVSCFLFNRETIFEAPPFTPGNVNTRLDPGNSELLFANSMDFTRDADTFAGSHFVNEDANADDLFQALDVDLTTNRIRLHIVGLNACQYLAGLASAQGTAVTSTATGWALMTVAADV